MHLKAARASRFCRYAAAAAPSCLPFSGVSQSGDLIVLWYGRAEGIRLPVRAFANDEMRQTFIGTVRERLPRAGA
jgi:hypothetical protein